MTLCKGCGFHARGCSCSTGCKTVTKLEALGLTALPPAEEELIVLSPAVVMTRAEYYARRARGGT